MPNGGGKSNGLFLEQWHYPLFQKCDAHCEDSIACWQQDCWPQGSRSPAKQRATAAAAATAIPRTVPVSAAATVPPAAATASVRAAAILSFGGRPLVHSWRKFGCRHSHSSGSQSAGGHSYDSGRAKLQLRLNLDWQWPHLAPVLRKLCRRVGPQHRTRTEPASCDLRHRGGTRQERGGQQREVHPVQGRQLVCRQPPPTRRAPPARAYPFLGLTVPALL